MAGYGPNHGSYPTKLKLINSDIAWAGKLDSDSDCLIYTDDLKISMSGTTKVKAEKGIYTFNDINMIAQTDYQSLIKFQSSYVAKITEI